MLRAALLKRQKWQITVRVIKTRKTVILFDFVRALYLEVMFTNIKINKLQSFRKTILVCNVSSKYFGVTWAAIRQLQVITEVCEDAILHSNKPLMHIQT
jgi:aspartate/tyrosine/aromatic aminotransferase